jgi:HEAT repeat protein
VDVAFATAFGTLVSGVFLVGYMKSLGASDVLINLLAALPSLVGILQIPGGVLGRSVRSYKSFVAPGGLTWRLLYVPFLLLPLGLFSSNAKLMTLTLCVALASAASVFVGPVYNDWIGQLVPASSRGFYFARRNAIAAVVGAIVGILGAVVLDAMRERHQEKLGFTTVYAMGIVCAFISWFFFTKMADLVREHPIKQTLRQAAVGIAVPFRDPTYRPVLIFLGASAVGQGFAGNLFVAYARESLHLDYKIIQGTQMMMAFGNIAAATAWGFLADKYGNKPVLLISSIALAVNPIPWMLCQADRPGFDAAILLTAHVYMGVVWAGINLCGFNILLATANPDDRANYIGAATTVTALVGGIAPLLGGFAMQWMRGDMIPMEAYRVIFAFTAVLRISAVAFIFPIKEKGSVSIRATLRELSGLSFGGVRALRVLTRPADMETREAAIERAGDVKVALASDEIIKALHDPLPRVRRHAAMAIAKLDDPRAVSELVHQIEDHPDILDEETVHALGAVGTAEAFSPLMRLLDSPRPIIRRAAARALGRICARLGAESLPQISLATDRLIAIARDPTDPDLRRSVLQALRAIGTPDAEEAIVGALDDPRPSVRVAAAEAVEELAIASAAPALRLSLEAFHDEASAEVAYTLGVVGDLSDIPLILKEAQRSVSMITRRRCLLGVARLLGVEADAYRLLLTEGMARDAAVQERLKPMLRSRRRLQEALSLYGAGDEPEALKALAEEFPTPEFKAGAEQPVEELFVVLALAAASRGGDRRGRLLRPKVV